MLDALQILQQNQIIHRDIKPENLMFQEQFEPHEYRKGKLILVDFGLATKWPVKAGTGELFIKCGTPGFVAPEICNLKEDGEYKGSCDLFSLGLLSRPVFQARSYNEMLKVNKQCIINWKLHFYSKISSQSLEFLKGLLERDPDQRMTIHQALSHPFIQTYLNQPEETISTFFPRDFILPQKPSIQLPENPSDLPKQKELAPSPPMQQNPFARLGLNFQGNQEPIGPFKNLQFQAQELMMSKLQNQQQNAVSSVGSDGQSDFFQAARKVKFHLLTGEMSSDQESQKSASTFKDTIIKLFEKKKEKEEEKIQQKEDNNSINNNQKNKIKTINKKSFETDFSKEDEFAFQFFFFFNIWIRQKQQQRMENHKKQNTEKLINQQQ